MNVHDSERMAGLLEQAGYEADRTRLRTPTSSSSTPAACASGPRTSSTPASASCGCWALNSGHDPDRRRRRMRRAAGRRGDPEARAGRRRRHRRHPGHPHAADARRAGGDDETPRRQSRSVRGRHVSAWSHAPRAIRSRRTSRSSRAATSSAASASCRTPAGNERMRPKADILAEVREAADSGRREVQLLGQIVNHYAAPDDPACDFSGLLEAVHEIDGIERIRFASPHPRHVTPRFLDDDDAAAEDLPPSPSAGPVGVDARPRSDAPALHARELPRIGRRGFARRLPDVALSTDMIVGFPGETDADFDETMTLTASVRLPQHVLVQVFAAAEHAGREAPGRRCVRRREDATDRGASGAAAGHPDGV